MSARMMRPMLAIAAVLAIFFVVSPVLFPDGRAAFADGAGGLPPASLETESTARGPGEPPSSQHGDPFAAVFRGLAIIVCCAAIGRFAATKLKQSPVLGELAVGIIVGAILYQIGSPTVTIIRHSDLIQRATQTALSDGGAWEQAVRSTVEKAGLPEGPAEKIEQILLSRQFPEYLTLARSIQLFASLGVIMLLFMVGLEVSIKEMKAIGGSASGVAAVGVSVTFALAYLTTLLLFPRAESPATPLFVAAALCASSIGITARIFKDMNQLSLNEAKIVLGAAVIDDVLGLIVLAVVSAIAASGSVEIAGVLWIILKTALFLGVVALFGTRFLEMTVPFFVRLDRSQVRLLYPFALLMLLAWVSDWIGLASIIGAFAAGVIVKEESFPGIGPESNHEQTIETIMGPLEGILAPVFFVLIGLQVDIGTLTNVKVLLAGLALTAVAVAGKLAASLGAGRGADRLLVGIGMLPRVEVALIVASMGRAQGVLDSGLYSVIIIAVLLTVLMTPPLLKWRLEKNRP